MLVAQNVSERWKINFYDENTCYGLVILKKAFLPGTKGPQNFFR